MTSQIANPASAAVHQVLCARFCLEADEHNHRLDHLAAGVVARDKASVESYLRYVLGRMPLPVGFPRQVEVVISPHGGQAVVRLQLPNRDAVPTVRGYSY
jgi:restriction system protein